MLDRKSFNHEVHFFFFGQAGAEKGITIIKGRSKVTHPFLNITFCPQGTTEAEQKQNCSQPHERDNEIASV